MNAYIDSSVVLRIVLGEPNPLGEWRALTRPLGSRLVAVECLRAFDRLRLLGSIDDADMAKRRNALLETLASIDVVPIVDHVLDRAGDPFPVEVRTLDALHLASALAVREQLDDLAFATHDVCLGRAAIAMGFEVIGLA